MAEEKSQPSITTTNLLVGEIRALAYGSGGQGSVSQERARARLNSLGWMECRGQTLVNDKYPNLHGIIGQSWGTPDPGNTFRVPDLRGNFLRGWTHNAVANDRDADGRAPIHPSGNSGNTVGSFQADGAHPNLHTRSGVQFGDASPQIVGVVLQGAATAELPHLAGSDTRPRNAYVMHVIFTGHVVDPRDDNPATDP